jgi:hypothetical protein
MRSEWNQWDPGVEVNRVTGEIKFKRKATRGYSMIFDEGHLQLALDRKIWGQTRSILDYLMGKSYKGVSYVAQKDIAKIYQIDKTNVSRAIKKLIDHGYITKGKKNGPYHSYVFTDKIARKRQVQYKKVVETYPYLDANLGIKANAARVTH